MNLASGDALLRFLMYALRTAGSTPSRDSSREDWLSTFKRESLKLLRERMAAAMTEPLQDILDVASLIWPWAELESWKSIAEWLDERLDNSAWTVPALAGLFVSVNESYDPGGTRRFLGDFDLKRFAYFVGSRRFEDAVTHASADQPFPAPIDDADVTFENRMRKAQVALRQWQEERTQGDAKPE